MSRARLEVRYGDVPRPPETPERDPPDYLPFLLDRVAHGLHGHDEGARDKLRVDNPGLDGIMLIDATAPRPGFDDR